MNLHYIGNTLIGYLHRILAKDLVLELFADTGLCRLGSHLHVAVLSLRFQVATWDIL